MAVRFCTVCGMEFQGDHDRFCSDECREDHFQGRYEEAIQAGVLEMRAKEELEELFNSAVCFHGDRPINRSTLLAIYKRSQRSGRDEESEE